ncbi:hypothetical protein ACIPPJ_22920 [Streptomyces sp. NPDC086091]|uniref:hypothetical protein n=1 Tax=Streptomyces sp. NPDC086091 TaxID=3365751 RepID=UPI00381D9930
MRLSTRRSPLPRAAAAVGAAAAALLAVPATPGLALAPTALAPTALPPATPAPVAPVAAAVPVAAEAGPTCAGPDTADFPLTTRLHGGPDTYRAGGGFGSWSLDLTNTTDRTCANVHPVVVLVDSAHALKPSQPRLEFYADGHPYGVRFEATDEDELVGALTGEADPAGTGEADPATGTPAATPFDGFTVEPGRTLTVKLRLALTSDAVANQVTVNAAVVQRRGGDSEWVGQSGDYRFTVEPYEPHGTDDGQDPYDPYDPHGPHASGDLDASAGPHATDSTGSTLSTPSAPAPGHPSLADEAEELARTGLTSPAAAIAVTLCLLAAGTALVLSRRRR